MQLQKYTIFVLILTKYGADNFVFQILDFIQIIKDDSTNCYHCHDLTSSREHFDDTLLQHYVQQIEKNYWHQLLAWYKLLGQLVHFQMKLTMRMCNLNRLNTLFVLECLPTIVLVNLLFYIDIIARFCCIVNDRLSFPSCSFSMMLCSSHLSLC